MKQIKVTIKGQVLAMDYCSTKWYDEEEDNTFLDHFYITCGWESFEGLYVDDDFENDLIKQKGKYIKTKEFFHDLFSEEGDHPLPVECHTRSYYDIEVEYIIKLQDDEEFDIKKLQLVKSDYECPEFPYFIIADYILYDGKEIRADEDLFELCPDEKCYDTFTIDELSD